LYKLFLKIPCRLGPLAGTILSGQQPYWELKQQPSLFGPCAAVILSSQHPNCSLAHADKHSGNISDNDIKYMIIFYFTQSLNYINLIIY